MCISLTPRHSVYNQAFEFNNITNLTELTMHLSHIPRYTFQSRNVHTASITRAMMTSLNGNIFHVTGPLWGESTGHRWIPLTKAIDAELWCFLWSAREQTAE